ncbi:MAG TPA: DNA primase [Bryobacteraceae bacterium]|nr:DNA primase [Bryobacteraceae bacterium]
MDFVEQLKSSIDIVKVVGDYVRLRRVGATGRYLGLCPFHQEKTPSFNVNQGRQFFKCFGCGAGGDALKFVMDIEGMTFPEALRYLAERNGIPMPKRTEYADADSKLRGALQEVHALAAKLYQSALAGPPGAEARAYLERRGLTQESIERFELGYSDPGGQALVRRLSQESFTQEQIEASGLVRQRNEGGGFYDSFRGRLMFPIHNESGKVIAFGGRALRDDDQPKYLNSPETPIYRKTATLYNLHRARDGMRKSNRAVLVEGYMDVIGVHAAGVGEVVASCGTALTNPQVRAIHRHADTVIVNFDPDEAGANAAERALPMLLDESLHVKVLALDGGLDPDEYVKKNGAEAYRARVDAAPGYFHWLADRVRGRFDLRSSDGRVDAFKSLLPAVQRIPDRLERAAVASDVAGYLGVEPGLVLDQFKRASLERRALGVSAGERRTERGTDAGGGTSPHRTPKPRPEIPPLERILLNALVSSSTTRREVLARLSPEIAGNFASHEIFDALRLLSETGQDVSFAVLDARLGEASRSLLHEIVAADEIGDDAACLAQAEACLRRLDEDFHRRQLADVRARVKSAEREGNMQEALGWMAELHRLEREASAQRGGSPP